MDKLQVIYCVGLPSVQFISFGLRLFRHGKLQDFWLFFPFLGEGVGTEEGREHPLGLIFQEFIFSSGRKVERKISSDFVIL